MKGLIQRVRSAHVDIHGTTVGAIGPGLLLLLGVERGDDEASVDKLLHKVINYRVFADAAGKMNLNLCQAGGELLVVSQFTLAADTSKGLRPGFSSAASPEQALKLYQLFLQRAATTPGLKLASGEFGADMQVSLQNDGPVTFMLEV